MEKIMQNKKYTYANVLRWTKRLDVFNMDKIYFPININNSHWTIAVISMRHKTIIYYDSLGASGTNYKNILLRWVTDEAHRKTINVPRSDWSLLPRQNNVPMQSNGYDCGVFVIMCADYISDDLPLHYQQSEMHFYRRQILASILRGSLNYPLY
jgi:Ulp1 family protease